MARAIGPPIQDSSPERSERLEDSDVEVESPTENAEGGASSARREPINNRTALLKSCQSIAVDRSLPFSTQQLHISTSAVEVQDINDDLKRELAFCRQCLNAVYSARKSLQREGIPMARPTDYFAEMVKSDEHMEHIKSRMSADAVARKLAAEARKQRDLKKFGKAVQVAKLQERDRARKSTLNAVESLKRKRKRGGDEDVADAASLGIAADSAAPPSLARGRQVSRGADRASARKRQKKDAKYGFGGKKRHSKSNDAISSSDMTGFSVRKMKGQRPGPKRPGKSRRTRS